FPNCFEVARILCHSNCRKDKTDLLLEDWVWAKLRDAGFQLIGRTDSIAVVPGTAISTPAAAIAPKVTAADAQTIAPLATAKVQSPDGTLNIRSAPNLSANKLPRVLKNDEVVTVFGIMGGWAAIDPSAKQWVARRYLVSVDAVTSVPQ